MKKIYTIQLDGKIIGETRLEKADPPMGVVMGSIIDRNGIISYEYLKSYCKKNKIELLSDSSDNQLIILPSLDELKIFSEEGIEIKGLGNELTGINNEEFDITIVGISYPFYEEEFPHHVKAYEQLF